jgi:hypothetical protein
MPIKNTDGTPFQLKKPNPLLKTQDITGDAHIIHNFAVQEVTVKYRRKKVPVTPVGAEIGTPVEPPLHPEQSVAPTPLRADPEPTPVEPEEDDYLTDDDKATVDAVSCWCLPGEYKKHYDNLYGETRMNVEWGDKFLFEGVIVQLGEMNFQIWAQVAIKPPSIIFVRPHRRWWRVQDVQPHEDGFLMSCLVSENRPRFD